MAARGVAFLLSLATECDGVRVRGRCILWRYTREKWLQEKEKWFANQSSDDIVTTRQKAENRHICMIGLPKVCLCSRNEGRIKTINLWRVVTLSSRLLTLYNSFFLFQ
nr:hypothetical protein [Pandoravirus massiliensis]